MEVSSDLANIVYYQPYVFVTWWNVTLSEEFPKRYPIPGMHGCSYKGANQFHQKASHC